MSDSAKSNSETPSAPGPRKQRTRGTMTLMAAEIRRCSGRFTWDQLVERVSPWVKARLRSKGASASDLPDLLQDVVLKTFRSFDQYAIDEGSHFRSWVGSITDTVLIDRKRKPVRRHVPIGNGSGEVPEPAAKGPGPKTQLAGKAVREIVDQCLAQLNDKEMAVCTLRLISGLEPKEIAERLGMNPNTVRSHYARGSEHLRAALARAGLGPQDA